MTGIAIVAIPEEDDPVWKVSSEKIPHLTLLYMEGPLDNEQNTIQFVQHAVDTSLCRFGLSVDRRGLLGPDDADVLFFDKSYGGKELLAFRGYLLANSAIVSAYRKAEQYPMWTPHLTLGYPATPARPNPNDYGIHWINFDRVAVWVKDFEGPEFLLKRDDNRAIDIDASWSDTPSDGLLHWGIRDGESTNKENVMTDDIEHFETVDDVLEHFGVKGMHWGVRRDRDTPDGRRAAAAKTQFKNEKKLVRSDKRFARRLKARNKSLGDILQLSSKAAEKYNSVDIPRINNKAEYKGKNLKQYPLLHAKYKREQQAAFIKRLDEAAFELHGTNPSGTQRYGVTEAPDIGGWNLILKDV